MNIKTPESNKNKIPILIRSDEWKITEKTEDHVASVCLRNKLDEMIMQQNQKIVELNQKINQQSKLIEQLNQMMNQQNREKDDLNNHLYLQKKSTVILMADATSNPNATAFGSSIKRSEISAIYVKNTLEDVPSSAWDVSAARDESVMAWTCMASDLVSYILFLAANGDIYANPDCSYLFANYTNLYAADFSHLKTNLVINMKYMFSYCSSLKQLNISHWDVSKVTNMDSMFLDCLIIKQMNKGALSSWKLNPFVTMKNICDGTKFQKNPMDLFQS